MGKIKVLITVPNFNTAGSGKVTFKIASNLNKAIFDVHIGCIHNKGVFYNHVVSSKIPIHIFPYYSDSNNPFKIWSHAIKLAKFFADQEFDIVHSMNYSSEFGEALAANIAKIPYIYSKNNMSWGRKRWDLKTFLSGKVFAQNTEMIKQFYSYSTKVKWITDGVDTNEFCKKVPKKELLKKFNLSSPRNLITVANLVPLKGIESLLHAFLKLSEDHPKLKLFIVGSYNNEYGLSLFNWVKEKGLNQKVIFTGKLPNVSDYLQLCDIFILPTLSIGEGSPVALMEAMASGLYCIGSDVAGIRDQLRNCDNHLFPPGNSEALYLKLKKAVSLTPDIFDQEVYKHSQMIELKFDLNKELKLIEKEYLKLLKD